MADAVVRDRGYSAYDGPRHPGRAGLVVGVHTALGLINRKGSKRALGLAWLSAIVTGVVLYTEHRVGGANVGAAYPLLLLVRPYGVLGPALFVALLAAGGTIAEDRRAGALPFYFSRPLRPIDYLGGRLGGVFAALVAIAAAPALAVALYRVSLCDQWADALRALGVAAVVGIMGLLLSAAVTVYALLASALAGSRGAAQGMAGAMFVLPSILAGVGANVLDGPWASLLSVPHLVESTGAPIIAALAGEQRTLAELLLNLPIVRAHDAHLPPALAALALLALPGIGLLWLRARVETLGAAGGDAGGP
jgi:ABC-2 type transport system permease protein